MGASTTVPVLVAPRRRTNTDMLWTDAGKRIGEEGLRSQGRWSGRLRYCRDNDNRTLA